MPGNTRVHPLAINNKSIRSSTTTGAWVRLAIFAAILFLAPKFALADIPACTDGYIYNVVAMGPCTIGDLTFNLSNLDLGNLDNNEWFPPEIYFQPFGQGFSLSFPYLTASIYATAPQGSGFLDMSYTVSSSDEYLAASTISVSPYLSTSFLPGATECPDLDCSFVYGTLAVNSYNLYASQTFDQPLVVEQSGPNPIITLSPPVQSLSGSIDVNALLNSTGDELGAIEMGLSVDVTFTEVDSVPEPQSVFLLGTVGLLLAVPLRRLLRKGRGAE